jgi:hypothetical protein
LTVKKSIFARWLSLWLLVLSLPIQATTVQATLDRTQVQLGETVTLNVSAQGIFSPGDLRRFFDDLNALNGDFEVVNMTHDGGEIVVNGYPQIQLTIGIALRPRHAGEVTVPSLNIAGETTSPITVQVDDANAAALANAPINAPGGVYMEASIEPSQGYVGQQLQYVLRLYYQTDLRASALDDPQADGMNFLSLGNELNYETDRGGQHYHVIERHYAAIPQRAGKLVIPPVQFQGASYDYTQPLLGASTPSLTVQVHDIPPAADKRTWLPVSNVKLTAEGLPTGTDVHVGQPLNLTMLLEATGTLYESLPDLSLPPIDGANVYPDKPFNGTRSDGRSLVARRQQSFAIIPSRPGTLVIPEITVHWWNVITNQPEVARLPEQRLTVLPAVGQPAVTASVATASSAASAGEATVSPAATAWPWRWIALASLGLWLLSLLAWWLRRRRSNTTAPVVQRGAAPAAPRQLRAAFLVAAQGDDAARQAGALMAWAKAERPSLQNLGDLAAELGSLPQREAIASLQRRRYAVGEVSTPGRALAEAFRDGFIWKAPVSSISTSGLPALYPFDVHADDKRPSSQD